MVRYPPALLCVTVAPKDPDLYYARHCANIHKVIASDLEELIITLVSEFQRILQATPYRGDKFTPSCGEMPRPQNLGGNDGKVAGCHMAGLNAVVLLNTGYFPQPRRAELLTND